MCGLRRVYDLPAILFEHVALIFWQSTLWIVQDQTGTQRGKGCVNMNGIRIAGKVHGMDAMIGEMAAQPFDALQVCRKPVLHNQIFAKSKNICRVK